MKKIFLLLFTQVALLAACNRSGGFQNPLSATLLVKTVSYTNNSTTDSLAYAYSYDQNGRIIAYDAIQVSSGNPTQFVYNRYYRDLSGRINRIAVYSVDALGNAAYDTVFTNVVYTGASSKQVAYATTITQPVSGQATYDSLVFQYGSNGRPAITTDYSYVYPLPSPIPVGDSYTTWTWNAHGQLGALQLFEDPAGNGNGQLNISYQFSYDQKINPLYTSDDILLVNNWYAASSQNITVQNNIFPQYSYLDGAVNTSYKYRPDNRPDSSYKSGTSVYPVSTIYYYNH